MRRVSPLLLSALLLACAPPPLARGDAHAETRSDVEDDDDDDQTGEDSPAPVDDAPGDGPAGDGAGTVVSDGGDADGEASRCVADDDGVRCSFETRRLPVGLVERDVHFQIPTGAPPPAGFPVVLLFQGSFFSGELSFAAATDDVFGAIHQTRLVQALLDGGYAVLAPEAHLDGGTYWDTNVPPWSFAWSLSPDHAFMEAIFAAIGAGDFGPLDDEALFATGISSGGFMTSRMAVSYPGRFRALAIHSASYATCSALCVVPALPDDHPPTVFITGEDDVVVPARTTIDYEAALRSITETELILVEGAGHAWLEPAPGVIPAFFDRHR